MPGPGMAVRSTSVSCSSESCPRRERQPPRTRKRCRGVRRRGGSFRRTRIPQDDSVARWPSRNPACSCRSRRWRRAPSKPSAADYGLDGVRDDLARNQRIAHAGRAHRDAVGNGDRIEQNALAAPASAPAAASRASSAMCMLQGVTLAHVEAMPICGFVKSASLNPVARNIAREGACFNPSTTSRKWRAGRGSASSAASAQRVAIARTGSGN